MHACRKERRRRGLVRRSRGRLAQRRLHFHRLRVKLRGRALQLRAQCADRRGIGGIRLRVPLRTLDATAHRRGVVLLATFAERLEAGRAQTAAQCAAALGTVAQARGVERGPERVGVAMRPYLAGRHVVLAVTRKIVGPAHDGARTTQRPEGRRGGDCLERRRKRIRPCGRSGYAATCAASSRARVRKADRTLNARQAELTRGRSRPASRPTSAGTRTGSRRAGHRASAGPLSAVLLAPEGARHVHITAAPLWREQLRQERRGPAPVDVEVVLRQRTRPPGIERQKVCAGGDPVDMRAAGHAGSVANEAAGLCGIRQRMGTWAQRSCLGSWLRSSAPQGTHTPPSCCPCRAPTTTEGAFRPPPHHAVLVPGSANADHVRCVAGYGRTENGRPGRRSSRSQGDSAAGGGVGPIQ